jgi:hypothetical protein
MLSFPANFVTEMLKDSGVEWRTLLEIEADDSTLYYSDQKVTVGAQVYSAQVKRFNRIGSGRASIELYNIPRIDDQIKPNQIVKVYLWMTGLADADKALIFKGVISEDIRGSLTKISFTCNSMASRFDKQVGELIDTTTWPDADPSIVGKIKPIGYGSVEHHKCLPVSVGMVTTLREDITSSVTTIPISNYEYENLSFPSSGTVKIGDEEITYTGVTQTDTPSLTGCTRGANGTTATSHSYGDAVLENISSIKYIVFGNEANAITKPAIVPTGGEVADAVQVDSADYSVNLNDSGDATITLTNLARIKREVSIAVTQQPDQPVTSTGSHSHSTAAITTKILRPSTVISSSNFTAQSQSYDSNMDTHATGSDSDDINDASASITWGFPTDSLGTLNEVRIFIKSSGSYSSGQGNYCKLKFKYGGIGYNQEIDLGQHSAAERGWVTSISSWSQLARVKFKIYAWTSSSASSVYAEVYEVWFEVDYTPDIASHAADGVTTTRTTDVVVGGDAVAAYVGGHLIVNAEGQPDDGTGHYTGTAGALIEHPAQIYHHLIENYSNGAAHSDIDISGTFQDVIDNLTYKWGFVITEQESLISILKRMAIQTWCRFDWGLDGVARLNRILTDGTSIRSLDTDSDCYLTGKLGDSNRELDLKFADSRLDQIANKVRVRYKYDPMLGNSSDPDAYNKITDEASDSDSITAYEEQKKTWNMPAVSDDTMADDLRDKLLDYYKVKRRAITFPTDHTNLELWVNDLIQLTCSQFEMEGRLHSIFDVTYDMMVPKEDKGLKVQLTLIDLLRIFLSYSDSFVVTDSGKTDINLAPNDSAVITDSSKIDINLAPSDSAIATDSGKVNIDLAAGDSIIVTDSATIHSKYTFNSALKFNSARKFNGPVP